MFHAVPDRGVAVAYEAHQVSGRGTGNDRIGLLGQPAFLDAGALQHEAARLVPDVEQGIRAPLHRSVSR